MTLPTELKNIFAVRKKSYKMVLMLAFLKEIKSELTEPVPMQKVVSNFLNYFQERELQGKPIDQPPKYVNKERWNELSVSGIRSLVDNPLEALKDVLYYDSSNQTLQFHNRVLNSVVKQVVDPLQKYAHTELAKYFDSPSDEQPLEELVNQEISDLELITHIDAYIASKGFYFERSEIINLYLSLKTKPFIILSGISGTGKTKIVQWFAESLGATEDNGQFTLIPVRPDWSDGSDLIGYTDIKGDFQVGRLTKVLLDALKHQDRPYFVLLDEMNLARVEYYFSDLLSVMESRKWVNGQMVTSPVLEQPIDNAMVTIPPNVFFIGTVNMDETTHPFSKKVLDRANTIEFNQVKLDYFDFFENTTDTVEPLSVHADQLVSQYLRLKDGFAQHEALIRRITADIMEINQSLERIGAHVGYRVRDEICFYLAYNAEANLMDEKDALDHQWLQKILPRISGSDSRVFNVLNELFTFFSGIELTEEQMDAPDLTAAKYPRAARKVFEMRGRYVSDGFTSYWL